MCFMEAGTFHFMPDNLYCKFKWSAPYLEIAWLLSYDYVNVARCAILLLALIQNVDDFIQEDFCSIYRTEPNHTDADAMLNLYQEVSIPSAANAFL